MPDAPTDVTLGEVWRGLEEVKTILTALRTELSKEVETQVTLRLQAQGERIGRLEKVVYGAVGLILTIDVAAVLALVIDAK